MPTKSKEEIKQIVYEQISSIPAAAAESDEDRKARADRLADTITTALIPDTTIYRTIVTALAVVAFTASVGAIVLVARGNTPLDAVVALGSAAVGALAGALLPQKQG